MLKINNLFSGLMPYNHYNEKMKTSLNISSHCNSPDWTGHMDALEGSKIRVRPIYSLLSMLICSCQEVLAQISLTWHGLESLMNTHPHTQDKEVWWPASTRALLSCVLMCDGVRSPKPHAPESLFSTIYSH